MKTHLNIAFKTLTLAGSLALALSANAASKPLNVLMIAVDDLNNEVGAWGGQAITPNIDRLAASGVQFKHAHAVVPACNPSRVALLTGRRPQTTGLYGNPGNFRDLDTAKHMLTLPQFLKQNGYETVSAGKIFHNPRGKKEQADPLSDPISWSEQGKVKTGTGGMPDYLDKNGKTKWLKGDYKHEGKPIGGYLSKFAVWGPIDEAKEETGDFEAARYCADYLSKPNDKPFFLACGIFRPHSPQLAPKEFFELYPIDKIELPFDPYEDIKDLPKVSQSNFSTPLAKRVVAEPEQWKKAIQAYLASTSFADAAIGEILKGLEKSPHKDNTIVVLWGDHGWQWAQKFRWEKFSLWHKGTNTPFIIKVPGMQPVVVNDQVSLLDVWPTLMTLMEMKTEEKLEGNDLTPLMKDPNTTWEKPAVITYEATSNAVRYKQWNFIKYKDGSIELYDISTDPLEHNNLANDKKYSDIIQKLEKWVPAEGVKDVLKGTKDKHG